eukprot:2676549-Heterocapsa_arctica.AAC.1
MDFLFMRTGRPEDTLATLLLGYRAPPPGEVGGYGFGRVVQAKGRWDVQALSALHAWFSEAGLNGPIRLRTDGEPAIRTVAHAAAHRRAPA